MKMRAMKHLRLLKDAPVGQSVAEDGVFKGYFSYSIALNSKDERIPVAEGIRSPVLGVRLEYNSQDTDLDAWNSEAGTSAEHEELSSADYPAFLLGTPRHTGQKNAGNVTTENMATLEGEVFLAQKIFHGETGRYAETWAELAQIAHFRFEGKDHYDLSDEMFNSDITIGYDKQKNKPEEIDSSLTDVEVNRQITSTGSVGSSSKGKGRLEIESIADVTRTK
jgi:hypothetical protein